MKAKTHLSQNKSRGGFTLVEMLVVIGMIAALAGISFPVYKSIQKKVEKQQQEMVFIGIEKAVDNFETEYNYLPCVGAYPNADGFYVWAIANSDAVFMGVLMGLENTVNFKQIKFFEPKEASGSGLLTGAGDTSGYRDGVVDNGDGTAHLFNSIGMKYCYFIDHDLDGNITNLINGNTYSGYKVLIATCVTGIWDGNPLSNFLFNHPDE
jgi:prepilin-type N-terminal cleavage/methylation domain-containing protein